MPAPAARGPTPRASSRWCAGSGLLQLDSVNVLLRAHYMPVFSRLGPYDPTVLDRLAGHTRGRLNRRLVEYWAHEASLIPVETHPLLRWRMENLDGAWGSMQRILDENPTLVADTLQLVRDQGPIRAGDTGLLAGLGWAGRIPTRCGTGMTARSRSSTCSTPAR